MNTDTPETDQYVKTRASLAYCVERDTADFARRLERERDNAIDARDCATDLMRRAIAERNEALTERDQAREQHDAVLFGAKLIDAELQKTKAERDEARAELEDLRRAVRNLRDVNGRHHSQQAMEKLIALLPESAGIKRVSRA